MTDDALAQRWAEWRAAHPRATARQIRAFGLTVLLEQAAASGQGEVFTRLAKVSREEDRHDLERRKLSMARVKKKAKENPTDGMTDEERERRIHELLGM